MNNLVAEIILLITFALLGTAVVSWIIWDIYEIIKEIKNNRKDEEDEDPDKLIMRVTIEKIVKNDFKELKKEERKEERGHEN